MIENNPGGSLTAIALAKSGPDIEPLTGPKLNACGPAEIGSTGRQYGALVDLLQHAPGGPIGVDGEQVHEVLPDPIPVESDHVDRPVQLHDQIESLVFPERVVDPPRFVSLVLAPRAPPREADSWIAKRIATGREKSQ